MISIIEAISDLLFVRDTVVMPGLGAFVKEPVSAKVNPVANHFTMPTSHVEFNPNLREDNDLIVSYLLKNGVAKEEAKKLLAKFVSDSFSTLKSGKRLVLEGLGALYYDGTDDLVFEQDSSVNYNSDAFGLCDFSLEPILMEKSKAAIKDEIEKQQKEKNTPVTVDEKAVHEEDEKPNHRSAWLWVLLGLLIAAGALYGLHKFGTIRFPWEEVQRGPMSAPGTYKLPFYEKKWEWKEPVREANIWIVAGIYGHEEDAARLVNSLHKKGFSAAFHELRGDKWYVSFDRYATDEEATAALREIRANTEYKAWILK